MILIDGLRGLRRFRLNKEHQAFEVNLSKRCNLRMVLTAPHLRLTAAFAQYSELIESETRAQWSLQA
jgi:hypothetical protein